MRSVFVTDDAKHAQCPMVKCEASAGGSDEMTHRLPCDGGLAGRFNTRRKKSLSGKPRALSEM
jgi:hypothetical protein